MFKPLSAELGLTRAVTSVGAGIGRFEMGIFGPITGWLTDKVGPKRIIATGVILVGVGLLLFSQINSVWLYYIVWGGIIATGVNLGLTLPVDKAITDWFIKKRGLAIGIKFAFIGIGGIAVVPIASTLTDALGWRWTSAIWGLVALVSLLLIVFLVRSKRPEYYGLLPDGARVEPGMDEAELVNHGIKYSAQVDEVEFTLGQAVRTRAFWMLIIAGLVALTIDDAIITHSIPFLTDMGIDPVLAGFMMSILIFFTIPSRFFTGIIIDRLKKSRVQFVLAGAILLMIAGITLFLLFPSIPTVYVFFTLYGIGAGAPTTLIVLMRARYFGRKNYGSISGLSMIVTSPVGLLAPVYPGWVYDTTGSYATAFQALIALGAVCMIMVLFMKPPSLPAESEIAPRPIQA